MCTKTILLKKFSAAFSLSLRPVLQRQMNMNAIKAMLFFAACTVLTSCDDVFSYHPYDVRFDGDDHINERNMARIEAECAAKETIKIAFISDTHGWYGDTEDMVGNINSRGDVDFVIHGGDLTDCATTKEFVWTRDILQKLTMPYVALLGNHDILGTGEEVFREMYGEVDFAFIAGRVKFICLNTNATEYDYMAPIPNFDFIERQAKEGKEKFDRAIICMHSRPYCDQFNNNVAKIFAHFYREMFPNLMFCINGHGHRNAVTDVFDDGILYYEVGSAENRCYSLFTITPDGYSHETIHI